MNDKDDWSRWTAPPPPEDPGAIRTLASIPQGGSAVLECRSLLAAEDLAAKLRFALLNQVGYGAAVVRVVEIREVGPSKVHAYLQHGVRVKRGR